MSSIRINLNIKLINVGGLLPTCLNRIIDWQGGRAEYDAMRAELQRATDVASKANRRSPVNYIGTHHLSEILCAMAASGSEGDATSDAAARWLISWVLSQPVPDCGGIYADHLDRDWLFNFADEGKAISMVAARLPDTCMASSVTPIDKRTLGARRRQPQQRRRRR